MTLRLLGPSKDGPQRHTGLYHYGSDLMSSARVIVSPDGCKLESEVC